MTQMAGDAEMLNVMCVCLNIEVFVALCSDKLRGEWSEQDRFIIVEVSVAQ